MEKTETRWGLTHLAASVLTGVLALSSVALAKPSLGFANLMPKDTVLYLEWSGWDTVADARASTALGKLLAEPEMRRFGAEVQKAFTALTRLAKEDEEAAAAIEVVMPLVEIVCRKRVAFDLLGAEMTARGPGLSAVLAVEVGDQAEAFMKNLFLLRSMLSLPEPTPEPVGEHSFQRLDLGPVPPIRYGVVDGVFLLAMGINAVEQVLAAKSGSSPNLSANESFASARRRLESSPANTLLTLHLDSVRLQAQARSVFAAVSGAQEFPPPVPVLLEELGVNGITSFTYTAQFKNGAYRHAALLATKGPSKGLLKLMEAKPLSDQDFYAVAHDASFAQVSNFDLKQAFDEALRIVGELGGEPQQIVTQALQWFENKTKLKLREDLIGLFDDGWAVFDAPSNGGLWFTGMTCVIETSDAKAFLDVLDKAVGLIREAVGEKYLTERIVEAGGHTVHYGVVTAGPIPVSPAWGAQGNRVVIALFPQMVQQTLERMAASDARERCILANPDFVRGRKLLPESCSSVKYVNTKQGISDLYTLALPGATAGISYACSEGIALDPAAFPSRECIVRHLFGDVSGISRCEEGILFTGHGPLPVSIPATIGGQQNIATSAIMISVLLPSLARARELSKRVVSSSNLSAIGKGCYMYANDRGDRFPPSLQALIEAELCEPKALISPRDRSPDGCSYEYIKGQTTKSDPRNVLAYEPDYDGEGGNILFVDGHVEWTRPPRYQQLIDETNERFGGKSED